MLSSDVRDANAAICRLPATVTFLPVAAALAAAAAAAAAAALLATCQHKAVLTCKTR